jgi:hypothetical protein
MNVLSQILESATDVRLAVDGLARIVSYLRHYGADLVSGLA